MKTIKDKEKDFDAVKMMREIRQSINSETNGMTFEQLRNYINAKLSGKTKLIGKK